MPPRSGAGKNAFASRATSLAWEAWLPAGGAARRGAAFDGPVQALMREIDTMCSQPADTTLAAIGLRMKALMERSSERVQNLG